MCLAWLLVFTWACVTSLLPPQTSGLERQPTASAALTADPEASNAAGASVNNSDDGESPGGPFVGAWFCLAALKSEPADENRAALLIKCATHPHSSLFPLKEIM